MKRLLIIILFLAVTSPISARVVLCDDNCKVEFTEGTESEPRFAVVSPAGMPTVKMIEQALIKTARRPTSERVFANYYANPGSNPEERRTINQWQWHISNSEDSQNTPPPVWHATSDNTIATIPTMKRGMTAIIITGDQSHNKVQIMPGGGFTSRTVR
ncbi:MAG: hypothetical protein IJ286_01975 [Alistipes sp.]|nr:hypothetical protein [Alistipes sp.]